MHRNCRKASLVNGAPEANTERPYVRGRCQDPRQHIEVDFVKVNSDFVVLSIGSSDELHCRVEDQRITRRNIRDLARANIFVEPGSWGIICKLSPAATKMHNPSADPYARLQANEEYFRFLRMYK